MEAGNNEMDSPTPSTSASSRYRAKLVLDKHKTYCIMDKDSGSSGPSPCFREPALTVDITKPFGPPLFETVPSWENTRPQFFVVDFDSEEPDPQKRRAPYTVDYLCHAIHVMGGGVISSPENEMVVIARMAIDEEVNRKAIKLYSSHFNDPIYREDFIWDSFRNKKVPRLKRYQLWPEKGDYVPRSIEPIFRPLIVSNSKGDIVESLADNEFELNLMELVQVDPPIATDTNSLSTSRTVTTNPVSVSHHSFKPPATQNNNKPTLRSSIPALPTLPIKASKTATAVPQTSADSQRKFRRYNIISSDSDSEPNANTDDGNGQARTNPAGSSRNSSLNGPADIYNKHGGAVGRVSPISDFEFSDSGSEPSSNARTAPRQGRGVGPRKQSRNAPMSHSQQQDMLNYIIRHNRHGEVFGKQLYVDMEGARVVPGRNWHTLNNNFRRVIAKPAKFRTFTMSGADRAKLQRAINNSQSEELQSWLNY